MSLFTSVLFSSSNLAYYLIFRYYLDFFRFIFYFSSGLLILFCLLCQDSVSTFLVFFVTASHILFVASFFSSIDFFGSTFSFQNMFSPFLHSSQAFYYIFQPNLRMSFLPFSYHLLSLLLPWPSTSYSISLDPFLSFSPSFSFSRFHTELKIMSLFYPILFKLVFIYSMHMLSVSFIKSIICFAKKHCYYLQLSISFTFIYVLFSIQGN